MEEAKQNKKNRDSNIKWDASRTTPTLGFAVPDSKNYILTKGTSNN